MGQRIRAAFEEDNSLQESCGADLIIPHLYVLFAAARNWEAYIDDLRRKAMTLVRPRIPADGCPACVANWPCNV